MKKIWAIRKDAEAVSPVIATILMVAITVVLAAVLYVMVLGFGGGGGQTPTATFDKGTVTNGKKIIVLSMSRADVSWDDITVQLSDGTNFATWLPTKTALTGSGGSSVNLTAKSLGTLSVCSWAYDLLGNGYVNGGDYLTFFTYGGASTFSGSTTYSVTLIYEPTSERIGTATTFTG